MPALVLLLVFLPLEALAVSPGIFLEASAASVVHEELLLAVSHAESGFNPNALNVAGRPVFPSSRFEAERILKRGGENVDGGLMQINWRIWNKKIGLSKSNFLDPALNVLLESKILSHSVRLRGDWWDAVGSGRSFGTTQG